MIVHGAFDVAKPVADASGGKDQRGALELAGPCTYDAYMPNKTISVPDDVVPIIDGLAVPFSRWVTDQLRRYAARSTMSFGQQLLADAALAGTVPPSEDEARAAGERMERSAPW